MSVIKLKIEVMPEAGSGELGEIKNYVFNNPTGSNLSNTSYQVNVYGEFEINSISETTGSNGLSFVSDTDEDLNLLIASDDFVSNYDNSGGVVEDEENPSEFIWGIVPSSGEYNVKLTFTEATALRFLTITGDTVVGQYPTEAILNGSTTITNNSPIWTIDFGTQSDTHTIEFTKWSKINYNACLSKISVTTRYIELGKEFINSFSSLTQSSVNNSNINYGVVANSGNADINDINGVLETYVKNGVIESSNVKIELFANENPIQTHITTDSEYIENGKNLVLQLTNDVEKYKNINYEAANYNIKYSKTLSSIVFSYFSNYGFVEGKDYYLYNNIYFEENNGGYTNLTPALLFNRIEIKNPYFLNYSLEHFLKCVCEISQMQCVKDNKNRLIFVPVSPFINDFYPIHIPKYAQIEEPQRNLFVKNKFNNVSFTRKELTSKYTTVFDKTFTVYNKGDTDKNTKELGEGSKIIWDGTDIYYCFFVEVQTGNDKLNVYDLFYSTDGVYPYSESYYSDEDEMSASGGVVMYGTTDLLREEIDWKTFGVGVYRMLKYESLTSATFAVKMKDALESPDNLTIVTNRIGLKLMALQYNVSYGKQEHYNSGDKVFNLPDNELISVGATYKNPKGSVKSIYNYMADNIVKTYKNGVQTLNIRVYATDFYKYYATGKTKAIDFKNKGEIFSINQSIIIDKDNYGNSLFTNLDGTPVVWRITSVNFEYEEAPYISLEVQEAKHYYDLFDN